MTNPQKETFFPARPFKTRSGKTVEDFRICSNGWLAGYVNGLHIVWSSDGKYISSRGTDLDLMNTDEPLKDAS